MVWCYEEFAGIGLSSKSYVLARKQRELHKTKVAELLDEGVPLPLKSEYDRINFTL